MTVKAWLESGRDYEQGRQLYAALGTNDRLKRLLDGGPNNYNREALGWELTKLGRLPENATFSLQSVPTFANPASSVPALPAALAATGPAALANPAEPATPATAAKLATLAELAQARRPLYDERSGLHSQLDGLATDADRYALAVRIQALSRQLNENWNTTRYVEQHGELPPPPAAAPALATLAPAELLKRRNNLRSLVSKLKTKPARAADLAQAQTDLAAVEALLKDE